MLTYLVGLHKIACLSQRVLSVSMFLGILRESEETGRLLRIIKEAKMLAEKYNLLRRRELDKD